MRRRSVLLVALLAASACGGDVVLEPLPGQTTVTLVEVELDRTTYRPGDVLAVTISNRTAARVYGYNLCTRSFERFDGQDWIGMPPELRVCTAHLVSLPAGEQQTGATNLPADFGPGTYRLVQAFYDITPGATTSLLAMSPTFTIQ